MLYADYLTGDYFEADPEDIREKIEKVNEQLVKKLAHNKQVSVYEVEQYIRARELCGLEIRPCSWISQN